MALEQGREVSSVPGVAVIRQKGPRVNKGGTAA